jgi:hypothetical protein
LLLDDRAARPSRQEAVERFINVGSLLGKIAVAGDVAYRLEIQGQVNG